MYGIPKKASTWFRVAPKETVSPAQNCQRRRAKKRKSCLNCRWKGWKSILGATMLAPKKKPVSLPKKKDSYKDTDFAHTSKNQYGTSNIESLVEMIFPFASGCFSQIPAVNFQWISFRESFHRLWKPKNDKVETRNTMLQNQSQPFLCVKRNMVHQKMEA